MDSGDWVSMAGVFVAIALGVYGVFRDQRDRRESRRVERQADASRVTFWGEYINEVEPSIYRLTIRNDGPIPIVDARFYFLVESIGYDGTYEGWSEASTSGEVIQPGSSGHYDLQVDAVRHLDNPMRCSFSDGRGVSWFRYSNGKLVEDQRRFIARHRLH